MQFPKAQRFRSPPPDSIPPPGAYDVPVALQDDQKYKKGAMFEKSARAYLDSDPNKPDTFGLYNVDGTAGDKENQPLTVRKRIASGTAPSGAALQAERERHKQQLDDQRHRLAAQHEKDLAKLQAKVTRLEGAREELGKEKTELGKELIALKSENRHLTSKVTRAEALIAKHQSALPLLQTKLTDLQTSNEASRARKDADIAALTSKLAAAEDVLHTRAAELVQLRKELVREKQGRAEVVDAAATALRQARDEVRSVRVVELQAEKLRGIKLARQVEDQKSVVESLVDYSAGLEYRVGVLEAELREQEEDRRKVFASWRSDRELLVGPARCEKEWRQRARADGRDVEGLRDEVAGWNEVWEVEREGVRLGETVEKEARRRWREEKKVMKRDYEVVEGELDLAVNDEIPRLESLLHTTQTSLTSAESSLAALQTDIADLQQRLVDETERLEGELEEQRRIADDRTKEAERERVEKRRVVGLLAQTRSSEVALKSEVDSLSAELARLTPLLNITSAQQRELDHLARLSSAAEAESRALMQENAELVGHSNQGQRIRHVAQLREELAESRRNHLATTSSLAFAEQRISDLEAELSSYRPAPSSSAPVASSAYLAAPTPATGRSRITRPQLADALSASSAAAATPTPAASSFSASMPGVVIHEPSPSPSLVVSHAPLLSASAVPSSRLQLADDPPLLPPQLAKSQPAARPTKAPTVRITRPPPPPTAAAKKAKKLLEEEDAGSTSVRMEGRMSVSELFG
ncbi:hypothetical protein JCM8097_009572 [Rhodosporidiobolus ruineniae]